ncbi:MAG TPA: hypothetical protein VGB48_06915 [Allosphingosinicella sp.]
MPKRFSKLRKRALRLLGKAHGGRQQASCRFAQPDAVHSAAGQNIKDVNVRLRQARKVIGPEFPAVVLIQALLRNVRSHPGGEFRLFEPEPFALFGQSRSKTHDVFGLPVQA